VVQALRTLGARLEQTGAALMALCLSIGVAGAALSVKLRMPVVLAWLTRRRLLAAATCPGPSPSGPYGLGGSDGRR
jgi:benzoate membrane transport protein